MIIQRQITGHLQKMLTKFPIISITGPRQSGKTTLLKSVFTRYKYFNLELIDLRDLILADPIGFLYNAGPYVIFDEAQRR
jgi:predicted AAA+ superfamily ATPase